MHLADSLASKFSYLCSLILPSYYLYQKKKKIVLYCSTLIGSYLKESQIYSHIKEKQKPRYCSRFIIYTYHTRVPIVHKL